MKVIVNKQAKSQVMTKQLLNSKLKELEKKESNCWGGKIS